MLPVFISSRRGYVGVTVVVFLAVLSVILLPMIYPSKGVVKTGKCMVGVEPTKYSEITMPPLESGKFTTSDDSGTIYPQDQNTKYVLIREKVPVKEFDFRIAGSVHLGVQPVIPGFPGYRALIPTRIGEHNVVGKHPPIFLFLNEGIFFMVPMVDYNHPVVYATRPLKGEEETIEDIILIDVYMDKAKYDAVKNGQTWYTFDDVFQCDDTLDGATIKATGQLVEASDSASIGGSTGVVVPDQAVSPTRDQLQMQWILFQNGGGSGIWYLHCKPAVYLYPEKQSLINVQVFPKGELSITDPPYQPNKGWTVNSYPDGKLYTLDNQTIKNGYLYYESRLKDEEIKKPDSGWVVKQEDLDNLYKNILPKLGLNQKEETDFIQYWEKALPKSPYYFVGIIDKTQRDYLETLKVTPVPKTSIRFSLYFEPLNQPRSVVAPKIITPKRDGFTLVDWGGMIKLHPDSPFTCSQ